MFKGFGGEGGVTGNQTNTTNRTPATAVTIVSQWSRGEVIYNYRGHRSLLHTSRVWLMQNKWDWSGWAQRRSMYPNYTD